MPAGESAAVAPLSAAVMAAWMSDAGTPVVRATPSAI